jgi:hypothetical protein
MEVEINGIPILRYNVQHCEIISKSKTIPVQAWTGPRGSRRLRLPDFQTIGT